MIRGVRSDGCTPIPWVYDKTERLAVTWEPEDAGSVIRQADDETYWMLPCEGRLLKLGTEQTILEAVRAG